MGVPLQHVAVIMDGNGRWAKSKNLPRIAGHKQGAQATKKVIEACIANAIPFLTLYAFSSENWNRSEEEVAGLMELLQYYLGKELDNLHKNNVKLKVIGEAERLSDGIKKQIKDAEALTETNTALTLTIALSYGSRQEIVMAAKTLCKRVLAGEVANEDIDEQVFQECLYTKDVPDPDLLIRTSGEQRLSNFLLWQLAYTELFFTDILWPDFTETDFVDAITEFKKRDRRYGTT